MSESAWKWGPYRKGMGQLTDDERIKFAVRAIKRELVFVQAPGAADIRLETPVFGPKVEKVVKKFQEANDLPADGQVGRKTANALFRLRILELEIEKGIPRNWLRAQVHWESGDDPGAANVNTDGTVDRGLIQANSTRKPLTLEGAYDPATALTFLAGYHADMAKVFADCKIAAGTLSVGAWRTPVGAQIVCEKGLFDPDLVLPRDDPMYWGWVASRYIQNVNTRGREGWIG